MLRFVVLALAFPLITACRAPAPTTVPSESASDTTVTSTDEHWLAKHERHAGLYDLYLDRRKGRLYLRLPAVEGPVLSSCLYVSGLTTGLGSSAVGLDRGGYSRTRWIQFRRVGPRVLVEQLNPDYRAESPDPDEQEAAAGSFPTSVLWAGEVERTFADKSIAVDITSFAVRDAPDVIDTLRRSDQGQFSLDGERSVFDPSSVLAFPDNVAFEARVTYSSPEMSWHARASTPDAHALTFVVHHALVRLPDAGYRPRAWHAASGSIDREFLDFAAPLGRPLLRRYAVRHRLQHKPNSSEAVVPLVYYVDRGAPEPIRSALIEGASWWEEAFAAAGFPGAFRVELLPEGVHPLDVRYNVIQWVHRQTRGWSYGLSVQDPRTGEIIKGHVTLGSQRIRQDILLFEGLLGVSKTGTGSADDPVQIALARIRQLAAHEVGHTLGLQHNFAASTYGRASVMDYPAPKVDIIDGKLDLSDAYGRGVGVWDRQAIRYLYTAFAPHEEPAGLRAILEENRDQGWLYLNDTDARRDEAAHPRASLWDNGSDPIAELGHALRVRGLGMTAFGANNLGADREWADLEPVFVPLYFHHRYQQTAAMKWIGGMWYDRGPRTASSPIQPVAAADQRRALAAVLEILHPTTLDVPESVISLLAPGDDGERLVTSTWPAFDALGAAATATKLVLDELLEPARMGRLVDYHRRDPGQLSLDEVLERVAEAVFGGRATTPRQHEVARVVQNVVVDRYIAAAAAPNLSPWVRSRFDHALERLLTTRLKAARSNPQQRAHERALARRIERHLARPSEHASPMSEPAQAPPGSPIGMPSMLFGCGGEDHGAAPGVRASR